MISNQKKMPQKKNVAQLKQGFNQVYLANKLENILQFIAAFCLSFEWLSKFIATEDTKQGMCIVGAFHPSMPPEVLKKQAYSKCLYAFSLFSSKTNIMFPHQKKM